MAGESVVRRSTRIVVKVATGGVFLAIVVLLLMWLAGTFPERIGGAGAVTRPRGTPGRLIGRRRSRASRCRPTALKAASAG